MTLSRSPVTPILGLVGLTGALIAFVAVERAGYQLVLPARLALAGGFIAAGFWFACLYWRRIDETAKAAQKVAYFYGASFGGAVGLAVCAALNFPFASGLSERLLALSPQINPFVIGGLIVLIVQTVGFLIGWAMWWAARR
jgi:hypothetical protein